MKIKCLMVTGSNNDPRRNDDWWSAEVLKTGKEYTTAELIELAACDEDDAIWVYEGEDWEDHENSLGQNMELINGTTRKGHVFYPWDRPECLKLIRKASVRDENQYDFMEDWRREQAMEAGMMRGLKAFNEVMGYDLGNPLADN